MNLLKWTRFSAVPKSSTPSHFKPPQPGRGRVLCPGADELARQPFLQENVSTPGVPRPRTRSRMQVKNFVPGAKSASVAKPAQDMPPTLEATDSTTSGGDPQPRPPAQPSVARAVTHRFCCPALRVTACALASRATKGERDRAQSQRHGGAAA
jgi:hypothetical protein